MTAISNPYDALYTKLKNRLTVVHDNCEYTFGEYMLMKAGKNARNENMPVVARANESRAVSSIIDFVNEKLTAKNPPRKEKTMRRFPLRTSASTLLSAAAAGRIFHSTLWTLPDTVNFSVRLWAPSGPATPHWW